MSERTMIETEFGESLISLRGNSGATSSGAEMGYNGLGGKFHSSFVSTFTFFSRIQLIVNKLRKSSFNSVSE